MVDSTTIDPLLVIPIFAATSVVSCLALTRFACRNPSYRFVRWLKRNLQEIVTVCFSLILGALTILACCFIACVLLTVFADPRCHRSDRRMKAIPSLPTSVRGRALQSRASSDDHVIDLRVVHPAVIL